MVGLALLGAALSRLGAALVSPAALSIVTTTFAEGKERTKALGIWSAIAAGGGAVGLLLGGVLTQAINWHWIFFINVPVGLVAFALGVVLVEENRGLGIRDGIDVVGSVLITAGLMTGVYAVVKSSTYGWGSARTLGVLGAAFALIIGFVAVESRLPKPIMPLRIFAVRGLLS